MNIKLAEYKKSLTKPLRPRTVTLFLQNNKVLLGYKKKGFGKGYWIGIGGKVEAGEIVKQAAVREVEEEINVAVKKIKKVATLNFYFPHIKDESWNQRVHAFIATSWRGEPKESDEIKPQWFDKNNIPLKSMWDDASYWLPKVLKGKIINADFLFDQKLKVIETKFYRT